MVFGSLSVQDDKAIPVFAPPYVSQEPFFFSGMTIIAISYRVQASQIQHLVPQELELEDQPIMTSLFIHYGTSTAGEYNEYVHTVRVKYNNETYDYSIVLVLDNDSAIFAGREIFGYPKIFGRVNFHPSAGSRVTMGNVERPAGRSLVEFEFAPKAPLDMSPGEATPPKVLNLRVIPSTDPATPASREFVAVDMQFEFSERWSGEGSLKFNKGFASTPWANLEVVSYVGSWMGKSKAVLNNKVERFPL
ncbi:acetoacetate decarboxylase [Fusarium oxysporum f. sp. lycopersici 4287]|uniref:Acetoacetate decarboxylase n=3 Tax=Fusarium oxysporum TaxID=5507 RepID=A0A0J9URK5_FUSO4|nr:acetoacetate decarboxylase [Fusarium oxysporum f. sp. lycopersici 4287]EXK38522.1 acetoacetate decarboxylase [Fusarium oxysporum f. sp. melonis 26406]KAJ9421401.1 acetoacetate decarboxylase [Fusarium oxysporum]KNB01593.1 acetoacetate decarboxylase [Fusarium oxysporum f. sp. lycopersici 4287]